MKKLIIPMMVLLAFTASVVVAATTNSVLPQSLSSVPLIRGAAPYAFTVGTPFTGGASLLFTNCETFADTLGVVTQQLSNVVVEVGVGYTTAATWYPATVNNATNGLFSCLTQIPTNSNQSVYWQVRLTDIHTNVYYYPIQQLAIIPPLP